ncbi:sugar transport protein 5-like [Rutidosis leptorrhynchoides]|uniref:sugar transport protein 5-like n=1 Tax=Rutidosis leptorrhynchoides TaxID=125765 RepID=UPI003A9A00AF
MGDVNGLAKHWQFIRKHVWRLQDEYVGSAIKSSSGLMYGYDTTVSGGVMMMMPFLAKFFPSILANIRDSREDEYCLFNSHKVTAFVSSMFIAGMVSSLLAGRLTNLIGRRFSLITGGILFLMGNALSVSAQDVSMLISGRLFVGFGIGFANQHKCTQTGRIMGSGLKGSFCKGSNGSGQAAPVYITEMAPSKWRGALNSAFQFFICLGTIIASLINLAANHSNSNYGWRLALGCASVPAMVLIIGALFIPDTPSSLIQRGKNLEALAALTKVRSTKAGAEAELKDLIISSQVAKKSLWRPYMKLMEPSYRPPLVLTITIAGFQQLTGIGLVGFYAPVVMRTIGLGAEGSLLAALVIGLVNLASVLKSTCMVDHIGRKFMFLQGGVQIIFAHVFIACTLAVQSQGIDVDFPYNYGMAVLVLMCVISSAFGYSWGPLTWLVPSEILPIEVRTAGTAIGVATNFLITFILTQFSMWMLCSMKFGLFFFYGATTFLMTIVIAGFLPETKGVPLESMENLWSKHWFWKYHVPS